METDNELYLRIQQEEKAAKRRKETVARKRTKKVERERKEYERLKAKFEG